MMVKSLKKTSRVENYSVNFEIQMAEIREYERKLWENNRFCKCDANNIHECVCESEKKKRFRKRRKKKVNDEFSDELENLMSGKLPKN